MKQFLVFLIAFIVGFGFFVIESKTYANDNFYVSDFSARVTNISTTKNNYQLVILDSVNIDGENKAFKVAILNYNTKNLFEVGDNISGTIELQKVKLFSTDFFNSTYYRNNVQYYAVARTKDFKISSGDIKLNEKIQLAVRDKLDKNLTAENSAIAYSMVFGDKTEISTDIKSNFSQSGISHILAISGLHVGILCAVILYLLKLCKSNKYLSLIILSIVLTFYCYLCSFAPSVVRASIMAIVLTLSKVLDKRYDALSAIGLAGILILIFKPLYVFDIGFQLSFACVIGIAILYTSIYEFLTKIKIPKILSKGLAVSIATQIAIIPILLNVFKTFSILTVILNILVIPIFTVAFVFLIIFLPLSFITNFFANFLYVTQLILEAIKISATFVASIPYTFVKLSNINFAFYIGYYTSVLSISRMSLAKFKHKFVFCIAIACITLIYYLILITI